MTRRHGAPAYGKQFIGNRNTKEVHDLNKEETNCKINEIKSGHVVTFIPDTLETAKAQGYDNCKHCIGGSKH